MTKGGEIPINPEVLKWARETAGYSLDQLIKSFRKLDVWENGESYPTYGQLEALASKYKRPVVIFFFPFPPDEITVERSLRAVSEEDVHNLSPQVRFLFRKSKMFQLYLKELFSDKRKEQVDKLNWLKGNAQQSPSKLAHDVRTVFKITIEDQSLWESEDQALEGWRTILAQHGIFVFKDAFKDNRVSGFCIYDDLFPIIYINNSHSKSRQIFTMFHELGHLLLKENYLDILEKDYLKLEDDNSSNVEIMCNTFAGNFLVPDDDFKNRINDKNHDTHEIEKIAKFYKVSKEVILRKLLIHKFIDHPSYQKINKEWENTFSAKARVKTQTGGGNYFYTKLAYLGSPYFSVIFERYYQGRISLERAADYLDIKVKSFSGLDEHFKRVLSDVRI